MFAPTTVRSFAAACALTLSAPFAPAALGAQSDGCDPLDDLIASAVAGVSGQAGGRLAAAALGAEDLSPEDARVAASAGLYDASAIFNALSAQAQVLTALGVDNVDGISASLTAVATDLDDASIAMAQADYGAAAESMHSFKDRMSRLYNMTGQDAFPAALHDAYGDMLTKFDAFARMLQAMGDEEATTFALQPLLNHIAEGPGAISNALTEPGDFGFPSYIPAYLLPSPGASAEEWSEGGRLREIIQSPNGQTILEELSVLGVSGMIHQSGPGSALAQLGEAGTAMSNSLGLLSVLLQFEEYQCEPCGGCTYACANDAACGPCTLEGIGFGSNMMNPDQIWNALIFLGLLKEVDTGSQLSTEEMIEALTEAVKGLIKKLVARGGHLWAKFNHPTCVTDSCWIRWEESYCVDKPKWVLIPLPAGLETIPAGQWGPDQWDAVIEAVVEKYAEECGAE